MFSSTSSHLLVHTYRSLVKCSSGAVGCYQGPIHDDVGAGIEEGSRRERTVGARRALPGGRGQGRASTVDGMHVGICVQLSAINWQRRREEGPGAMPSTF